LNKRGTVSRRREIVSRRTREKEKRIRKLYDSRTYRTSGTLMAESRPRAINTRKKR
jgi:lactam utilization protein B